jgi:hypothetical protein
LGLEDQLPERDRNTRWVDLNTQFDDIQLDSGTLSVLAGLVQNNKLRQETMWSILQRGKILPETFDADVEATELETESLKQMADAIKMARAQRPPGSGAEDVPPDEKV